jgi:hypothetical protein
MSSSTLYGSFVVDISSSPFVNADLGVAWDAVLTCSGISTASSKHEVLWCHSGRQPVQRGSDFSGTYTDAGAITSTWSLKPSQ